ncbi:MAG: nuclear transport factor 2 family protein [Bacteroidota bacterium]
MTTTEQITQAITNFVKGGDNSDLMMINSVLHNNFRVTNNGYMGTPGVTVLDKQQYLSNVQTGLFGGVPRTFFIEQLDVSGKIAMVKLKIESANNHFISYNSMVLDTDNQWKIINNLAVVEPK